MSGGYKDTFRIFQIGFRPPSYFIFVFIYFFLFYNLVVIAENGDFLVDAATGSCSHFYTAKIIQREF